MSQPSAILAFVREWNASTVRVYCPFCLRTHTHGLGSLDFEHDSPWNASLKRRRAPHCGHLSDDYQMCFPFEDAAQDRGCSWFIDKREHKFVTVGLPAEIELESYFVKECNGSEDQDSGSVAGSDSTESKDDPAGSLASAFQSTPTIEDVDLTDFYKQEMADPRQRKSWFVSHCILGETGQIKHMLQLYREDRLFDKRDRYGDDIMSLVAMEGHVCAMELLHEAGAGVSNVNARGRTPLMEAALWGRDDAVKFLLGKGADPWQKDCKDRTALDLAQDTNSNRNERVATSPLYIESKDLQYARIRTCARLEKLRTGPLQPHENSPNWAALSNGHFRRVGRNLAWYNRAVSYDLDFDTRTVGILSYDAHTLAIAAMSGTNHYRPHPQTLDNRSWTYKVRNLCVAMGFVLRPDHRDRLFAGSFHACHAEKQLVAYYVDRHFFWGTELRNLDVVALEGMKPLGRPRKACIVVNRETCDDCSAFIRCVHENFVCEMEVLFR